MAGKTPVSRNNHYPYAYGTLNHAFICYKDTLPESLNSSYSINHKSLPLPHDNAHLDNELYPDGHMFSHNKDQAMDFFP